MCGIIGYAGSENAVPIIINGLKKLEYRGYDSAGLAVYTEQKFDVVKRKGRLAALESCLKENPVSGFTGIGHTRWATHGEPSDENSHPHLGHQNKIAIVHNGIIENYKRLRENLKAKGIAFTSQTDSEVIAQLAEYYYNGDIIDTIIKVANRLEGSYALGVMCLDQPGTLIAVRKDNPLIVGVCETGNFIASDIPAVLKHTNKVYYPDDKEIAIIKKDGVTFINFDKEPIDKELETISWDADSAEKGGYPHFMLKEIMEQPKVTTDTFLSLSGNHDNSKIINDLKLDSYNKLVITACGSAYNAGVVAKYVFEKLCRVSVEVELASEFRYKNAIIDEKTLVILISQSGETADTIAAMREAKSKGAHTLSIVNVIGSTIAKEADHTIYTIAGPEIAVATTKAFSAQLIVLYTLGVEFAHKLKKIDTAQRQVYLNDIKTIPEKIKAILNRIDKIQHYATDCIAYKSIFFIGRNIDYAIALEGSLKLKEISYIHSEAYAGGELKHGTISLIEDNTLVVALSNCERLSPKIMSNIEQVISRGAKSLLVGSCKADEIEDKLQVIAVPEIHELFSPSLSVIVLQLFSYYVAANKGLDIDKPRNLAKSVTVE
ncbi:MAG: glutamine--fructose-6-phosphate transaminase (isomerizing) [Oscillospiraceae bacterium]|nr:glutamine--fructose-6-phosphate transaminase (isomerizing) [Oscillospiraceae bacterium]